MSQLILGLALHDDATFDNFYPAKNEQILCHLHQFLTEVDPYFYLWGPSGSGKTHLLQACCHLRGAIQSLYLDLNEPGLQPGIFAGLESFQLLCLDNIEAILGRPEWELQLFDLYNRSRENNRRILIAGLRPPQQLMCQMADLSSRLGWGWIWQLQALDDGEKLGALQMRAERRGLELSLEVGQFLLSRFSRSMSDLFATLDILDKEAMRAKRRLTIPFIKQVLCSKKYSKM